MPRNKRETVQDGLGSGKGIFNDNGNSNSGSKDVQKNPQVEKKKRMRRESDSSLSMSSSSSSDMFSAFPTPPSSSEMKNPASGNDRASPSSSPAKKRQRVNAEGDKRPTSAVTSNDDNPSASTAAATVGAAATSRVDPELLNHAKQRLSKFAARLFDPNRPKGLVEPPQIIPLNDEFLTAFGKREKQFDEAMGKSEIYDHEIHSDDEGEDDDDLQDDAITKKSRKRRRSAPAKLNDSKVSKEKSNPGKVKIMNLAYRTSEETLTAACEQFGPLVEVALILDDSDVPPPGSGQVVNNSGRAYVTFENEDDAEACMQMLTSLDGRQLRINRAEIRPTGGNRRTSAGTAGGGIGDGGGASLLTKALDKDISTICFNCGKVGHIGAKCPNPPKLKPCNLCGALEVGHDMKTCPFTRICFNCGLPGHVSRDCTMRRGLPRRMVCGICFRSGHHRLQCRSGIRYESELPPEMIGQAICMVTGEKGTFSSQPNKWFYDLRGMSCFNCGEDGHSGYECQRPSLSHLINDQQLTGQEIRRAEAASLDAEFERELREQQERSEQRGRRRGGSGGEGWNRGGGRAKSQPPPQGQTRHQPNNGRKSLPLDGALKTSRRDRRGY